MNSRELFISKPKKPSPVNKINPLNVPEDPIQYLGIIQSIWNPNDLSTNARLTIVQYPSKKAYPTTQIAKVSFLNAQGKLVLTLEKTLESKILKTEVNYNGMLKIAAITISLSSSPLVWSIVDRVSLGFLLENIQKISDTNVREYAWLNIEAMVDLGYLRMSVYAQFISKKLFSDPSNKTLKHIIARLPALITYILYEYWEKINTAKLIYNKIYPYLQNIPNEQTERIEILKESFLQFSSMSRQMDPVVQWLHDANPLLKKRKMTNQQMWDAVEKIFLSSGLNQLQKRVQFEYAYKKDPSKRGDDAKITCDSILTFDYDSTYRVLKSQDVSIHVKKLYLVGWTSNEIARYWVYQQQFYNDIIQLSQTLNYDNFEFFYTKLRNDDYKVQNQIDKFNGVLNELQKMKDMEQHCKNIRVIIDSLKLKIEVLKLQDSKEDELYLTKIKAIQRFKSIEQNSISYNFHISFDAYSNYYSGLAEITFSLRQIPKDLYLDCITKQTKRLIINGYEAIPYSLGEFILINRNYLQLGKNTINIHYQNSFDNDGLGCMKFTQVSPNPKAEYIHTKFEPYGAHRFVPCFDQPDLKAQATFNVIVPSSWIALSNQSHSYEGTFSVSNYAQKVSTNNKALLEEYLKNKSGHFYIFSQAKERPTYLYAIAAGEYYKVSLPVDKQFKNIPMNLYCSQALSSKLNRLAAFIFELSTLSLKYYEERLGVAYPFKKQDFLFCYELQPQFKEGAMENPGIMTFNDKYLSIIDAAANQMLNFARVILYQNAHNWFGNLTTIKWWSESWLNQAFSDFIAFDCLKNIRNQVTSIKYDGQQLLYLIRLTDAYKDDQNARRMHDPTTQVPNTQYAEYYFDNLTCQKGSAYLTQLKSIMGEDKFFLGLHKYLVSFSWKIVTTDDMFSCLKQYYQVPFITLQKWREQWFYYNYTLNMVFAYFDEKNHSPNAILTVYQCMYFYPMRYGQKHRKVKIALFKADFTYDILEVLVRSVDTNYFYYDGTKNYVAILYDIECQDYSRNVLDGASRKFFKENMSKIKEPLLRLIAWHNLNQSILESYFRFVDTYQDLNITENFKLMTKMVVLETDDKIIEFQLEYFKYLLNNFVPIDRRGAMKTLLFEAIYKKLIELRQAKDCDNRKIILTDYLSQFATNNSQIELLENWRERANADLATYLITQDQAWDVVKLVYSSNKYSPQIKQQIYLDQYSTTPGLKGQLTFTTCNAITADQAQLSSLYDKLKDPSIDLIAKTSLAEGWNHLNHIQILRNIFKQKYYNDIRGLKISLDFRHFELFINSLRPIDDDLYESFSGYMQLLESDNSLSIGYYTHWYHLRMDIYEKNPNAWKYLPKVESRRLTLL